MNQMPRMSLFCRSLCSVLFAMLCPGSADAGTTLHADSLIRCPVCDADFSPGFVRWRIVEDDPDHVDPVLCILPVLPCMEAVEIVCCPFCLYSAFRDDFSDVTEKERRELQQRLGTKSVTIVPIEARILAGRTPERYPADAIVVGSLAEACYACRDNKGKASKLLFWRFAKMERYPPSNELGTYYRDALISLLATGKADWPEQPAMQFYLLGELRRVKGEAAFARDAFARARDLASKSDEDLRRAIERRDLMASFSTLSVEQLRTTLSLTSKRPRTTDDTVTQFSLRALLYHPDKDKANGALSEYVGGNIANLCSLFTLRPFPIGAGQRMLEVRPVLEWFRKEYIRVRSDCREKGVRMPEAWAEAHLRLQECTSTDILGPTLPDVMPSSYVADFGNALSVELPGLISSGVFIVYPFIQGESAEAVGKRIGLPEWRWESELGEQVKRGGWNSGGKEIRVVRTPADSNYWCYDRIMSALRFLLRTDSKPAAEYLGVWCSNLYHHVESAAPLGGFECLNELADHPELAAVVRQGMGVPRNRLQEVAAACMDYMGGDTNRASFLLDQRSDESVRGGDLFMFAMAGCLARRPNDTIRQWFAGRDRWQVSPSGYCWSAEFMLTYLDRQGTLKDLELLGELAKTAPRWGYRARAEDCMRRIRMRSLKMVPTATPHK